MNELRAEVWGRRLPEGRLIISREGEILTLVGDDETRPRFLPLLSFGQGVRCALLALREDYSSALAAAERLDAEAVRALELELIEELTRLTPLARQLVERRSPVVAPVPSWLIRLVGLGVGGVIGGILGSLLWRLGSAIVRGVMG